MLVEGKSEKTIYPAWLNHLLPEIKRVNSPQAVQSNNYYLFSSEGYPSVLNDIPNAVSDIKEINKFDYFIIAVDADELEVEERRKEVYDVINEIGNLDGLNIQIIIQNRCIETWCLGNMRIFPRHPSTNEFMLCNQHYRVLSDDPELMDRDKNVTQKTTKAQYHEYYLNKMLKERNLNYSKGSGTRAVQPPYYLEELIHRVETTDHIKSFKEFILFIRGISELIKSRLHVATGEEANQNN